MSIVARDVVGELVTAEAPTFFKVKAELNKLQRDSRMRLLFVCVDSAHLKMLNEAQLTAEKVLKLGFYEYLFKGALSREAIEMLIAARDVDETIPADLREALKTGAITVAWELPDGVIYPMTRLRLIERSVFEARRDAFEHQVDEPEFAFGALCGFESLCDLFTTRQNWADCSFCNIKTATDAALQKIVEVSRVELAKRPMAISGSLKSASRKAYIDGIKPLLGPIPAKPKLLGRYLRYAQFTANIAPGSPPSINNLVAPTFVKLNKDGTIFVPPKERPVALADSPPAEDPRAAEAPVDQQDQLVPVRAHGRQKPQFKRQRVTSPPPRKGDKATVYGVKKLGITPTGETMTVDMQC